jgi:hypothetical protein
MPFFVNFLQKIIQLDFQSLITRKVCTQLNLKANIVQGVIKIPEQFQEWQGIQTVKVILLRCDTVSQLSEAEYLALMERFSYAQPGHHWSRDELNGR